MLRPLLASLVLGAVALAGCGASDESAAPDETAAATTTAPAPARPRPRRGRTLRAVSSQYGTVVADRAGEALYLFDAERARRPACYGACAAAWPPVLARGVPVAGDGLRSDLLGTVRRRNGRLQVTYRGHPLYYYVSDAPGRILCHDVVEFGGTWLVLGPDGRARP